MRAVKFDSYGGPEVLYVADVDRPQTTAGRLLVRVRACSINPFDHKVREGLMEGMVPVEFPSGQGTDVAGAVAAVGEGVEDWTVGDEIFGATAARGSQAEYALVNPEKVARKPQALSWETAGAINTVGTTAYAMVAAVGAGPGDTVLVSGASGGVGSLACQLAVAAGATVIGAASQANHEWLKGRGVVPIAYGDGLEQRVLEAVGPQGLDAMLDTHGGGYVELGLKLGIAPERIDTIADFAAAGENQGVKTDGGMAAPGPQALQQLAEKIVAGELELRIAKVLPLDEVGAAYELLEHGHPQGKIVLAP